VDAKANSYADVRKINFLQLSGFEPRLIESSCHKIKQSNHSPLLFTSRRVRLNIDFRTVYTVFVLNVAR
jgi:hypothetical protein